jgi:hypothetical protein
VFDSSCAQEFALTPAKKSIIGKPIIHLNIYPNSLTRSYSYFIVSSLLETGFYAGNQGENELLQEWLWQVYFECKVCCKYARNMGVGDRAVSRISQRKINFCAVKVSLSHNSLNKLKFRSKRVHERVEVLISQ